MRRSLIWLSALTLVGGIGLGHFAGCTTIEVPVGGGDTTITGSIVDATDPTSPIGDAYVYVPVNDPGAAASARGGVYAADHSDATGAYELTQVPSGEQTLAVEGPTGAAFAGLSITLDLPAGATVRIQVTLTPTALASTISGVVVTPDNQTVLPGLTRQFTATVYTTGGGTADLTPTWIAQGGIGSIDGDGLFSACAADQLDGATPRAGKVVAIVADQLGSANVTVSPQLLVSYSGASDPTDLNFGELRSEWTGQVAFGVLAGLTPAEIAAATWTATSDAAWLTVDPATGGSAAPTDVTVRVDRSALADGTYTGRLTYASPYGEFETAVTARVLRDGSKIGWLGADGAVGYMDDTGGMHVSGGSGGTIAMSPDGTEAAVLALGPGGRNEVRVVDLATGATRLLTVLADVLTGADAAGAFPSVWMDWSSGGEFAFVADTGAEVLLRIADGSGTPLSPELPVVTHGPGGGGAYVAWSPDGTRVAAGLPYSPAGGADLALCAVTAGVPTLSALHNAPAPPMGGWSPDGSRIFLVDAAGVLSYDPSSGDSARALLQEGVQGVTSSPRGDRVAFSTPGPGGSLDVTRIWVADSNFANARIAHEGRPIGMIDWWATQP